MLNLSLPLPFGASLNLLAAADAVAAIVVTVHVLMTKRDVRAAAGWIGLAWLSPFVGALVYYLFGINRITRRASRRALGAHRNRGTLHPRQLPGTPDGNLTGPLAAIARVGARVTGRPLAPGNALEVLPSGDQAYSAMLEAIGSARTSVALASYIFRADAIGREFITALRAAAARGIAVRVLVDGIGGGYVLPGAVGRLQRAGISAARFTHHWQPWRVLSLNLRSHKKILVVDGAIGFTGGLNIGAENAPLLRRPRRVDDVHFRIRGPVVSQMMLTFAEDWNFTTGEVLDGAAWWPAIPSAGPVLARGISSGPDEDVGKLEAVFQAAVSQAQQRIRIVTPYFLPDTILTGTIALASLRGVEVEVLLPARSDVRLIDWASRAHIRYLPGVKWYVTPAPFDHAKLVTVDGHWCAVGSANWDSRSLRLNFEFDVECYDAQATAAVDRIIDARIARAHALTHHEYAKRSRAVRLRDSAARLLLPLL